jgi:hypothetical protein
VDGCRIRGSAGVISADPADGLPDGPDPTCEPTGTWCVGGLCPHCRPEHPPGLDTAAWYARLTAVLFGRLVTGEKISPHRVEGGKGGRSPSRPPAWPHPVADDAGPSLGVQHGNETPAPPDSHPEAIWLVAADQSPRRRDEIFRIHGVWSVHVVFGSPVNRPHDSYPLLSHMPRFSGRQRPYRAAQRSFPYGSSE